MPGRRAIQISLAFLPMVYLESPHSPKSASYTASAPQEYGTPETMHLGSLCFPPALLDGWGGPYCKIRKITQISGLNDTKRAALLLTNVSGTIHPPSPPGNRSRRNRT